ncbi:MAG: lysylphosphatidylglycerol synthase transmembrane domain-containing protein [Bdellovibrionota bacterium]|nr:lysylphosphatidylglycerol synthase transmembrane domain-containing protein [Bdellovibrionota bacterium]
MLFCLFSLAVFLMVLGHIFKAKRWALFISVYEKSNTLNLLNALSIGHILNSVLPIRIGDVFRIFYAGKKLKNGKSFSFATVVADLYVELLTVGFIFIILSCNYKEKTDLEFVKNIYIFSCLATILITIFACIFRKAIKLFIAKIASVFNSKIEFNILFASYLALASIKDIVLKINKYKFIFYTIIMWIGYLTSYYVFSLALKNVTPNYNFADIFVSFFTGINLYSINNEFFLLWSGYLILPLLITFLCSILVKERQDDVENYKSTLPQLNESDKLAFLKTYYAEENRDALRTYLEINNDVTILEDKSAGSNASTLLVMANNGEMFFRKYAFNDDSIKLIEQIDWIKSHFGRIPLPNILNVKKKKNFVSYDMPASTNFLSYFEFIHTMPFSYSSKVLDKVLNDIRNNIHNENLRKADSETVKKYIQSKVTKNLKIILNDDKYIKDLEEYNEIIVNGVNLKNLKYYEKVFNENNLQEIFINDSYSDIHGDLTIENIICASNFDFKRSSIDYYFIDPNSGNIHESPFLDYAKLLQSLHGKYEFLMMVKDVKIQKNVVNFMLTKSEMYAKLYEKFENFLFESFSYNEVRSIYYHELVHFLRLMPYKIRKNEKLAVVFYTGLLKVLNDIYVMESSYEK